MGKILDLGQRIELQPADTHCHDISLGLYLRQVEGVSRFLVHTYSSIPQAAKRVAFLNRALTVMLGLEPASDPDGKGTSLQFSCRSIHERAIKRAFLDLCKLPSDAELQPKPLRAFDKKADSHLKVVSLGPGLYEVQAEANTDQASRRVAALARGYVKVCQMDPVEGSANRVAFVCKCDHDALIGMLMFRAQNVRASMQEEEMAAARGVLAAPSEQR